MRVLGLDPGFAITGYGVVDHIGTKVSVVGYGAITTPSTMAFPKRLTALGDDLCAILHQFNPDHIAIEELFFNTNTKTAMQVAQARGILVYLSEKFGKPTFSYTPVQVKSSVCGHGGAEKHQVQYMVQKLLNLKEKPKPDDVADALAIAICHAHSNKLNQIAYN